MQLQRVSYDRLRVARLLFVRELVTRLRRPWRMVHGHHLLYLLRLTHGRELLHCRRRHRMILWCDRLLRVWLRAGVHCRHLSGWIYSDTPAYRRLLMTRRRRHVTTPRCRVGRRLRCVLASWARVVHIALLWRQRCGREWTFLPRAYVCAYEYYKLSYLPRAVMCLYEQLLFAVVRAGVVLLLLLLLLSVLLLLLLLILCALLFVDVLLLCYHLLFVLLLLVVLLLGERLSHRLRLVGEPMRRTRRHGCRASCTRTRYVFARVCTPPTHSCPSGVRAHILIGDTLLCYP